MSSDEEGVPGTSAAASRGPSKSRKFLPATLRKLFGGDGTRTHQRAALDEELRLMELLQAEYAEEAPDDGALEGSGDDFEP
ncbi:hypothetical protein CPB85DRAFT_1433512 [Mucidula mucida]|nr:hypothetical protein CPB85DRAFT_1433512 [Mucidula mucida]